MDTFSFVFSFFGLVLGLGLAELLSGFGKSFQSRRKVHIGLLSPLLGLAVSLDLTSFWMWAWFIRDRVPASYVALMCGLVVTGLYYLIARITFPEEPTEWPDYDLYYFEHRRLVIGGVVLCNLLAILYQAALGVQVNTSWLGLAFLATQVAFSAVVLLARSRRLSVIGLTLLVLSYPGSTIPGLLAG
ncbi:MAG TPA: hypothetical protein VIL42_03520 [Sphingomicrobium sp.]|jgi:hypothetical protein